MKFKNLAELQKALPSIIQSAIVSTDDVRSTVAKAESKAVEEEVYNAYDPKFYERRGLNGGLADPDNLELMSVGNNGKAIQMIFENTTMGNDSMEGKRISDGIENGNLDWNNPDGAWSNARPFMETAVDILKSDDELRQSVIKSLKSKNISAK